MFEISIYFPDRNVRYVASFGHGSPSYGQTMWVSLVREDIENGKVVYAKMLIPRFRQRSIKV